MKWLLLVAMVLGLALVGCGGAGEGAAAEPVEFSLSATDIAYDQPQLEVQVGQPVRVVLDNEGALLHDFSIREIPLDGEAHAEEAHSDETAAHEEQMGHEGEEPDVHVAAAAGAHGEVTFTPSAAGEYEYYCTVPGHKEAGMAGILSVTE